MDRINWPLCIGILAGLLAMIGAIAQWNEKKDESIKSLSAQNSLKILQEQTLKNTQELSEAYKENAKLQNILSSKSDNIIRTTEELTTLYKENAELQKELKNQVTGGDSKPKLQILTSPNKQIAGLQLIDFYLVLEGKYPLTQVQVNISDPWGMYAAPYVGRPVDVGTVGLVFYNPPRPSLADHWASHKEINVGTIQPGQHKSIYHTVFIPFNAGENNRINRASFTVDINWAFGYVRYSLEIDFDKGAPILKSVDIKDNYKDVNTSKYLEFNNYANME